MSEKSSIHNWELTIGHRSSTYLLPKSHIRLMEGYPPTLSFGRAGRQAGRQAGRLRITGYRLQVTNFLIPASSHFHIPTFAHFNALYSV